MCVAVELHCWRHCYLVQVRLCAVTMEKRERDEREQGAGTGFGALCRLARAATLATSLRSLLGAHGCKTLSVGVLLATGQADDDQIRD